MKNKFLNLLFLFCSLVLFVGPVAAEEFGESSRYDFSIFETTGDNKKETKTNYSSLCSKYTKEDEKIKCCNQAGTAGERSDCKKSIYQVCMDKGTMATRSACCEEKFTGDELNDCRMLAVTYCDLNEKVRLSKVASAIKIEYEPTEIDYSSSLVVYALDIKVYNITEDVYIVVEPEGGVSYSINSSNVGKDGYVTLRDDNVNKIKNYTFSIFSNTGSCDLNPLRTVKLSTPKYNHLSNREACREVPHYYKCQEFVSYEFETGNYVKDVEEYKEKLAKQGLKDTEEGIVANNGLVSKTIKKVSDNKWLVLGIVIIIGIAITYVLIKKRRDD